MKQTLNRKELAMTGMTFVIALATQCRIGCNAEERKTVQPILVDISCEVDLTAAVTSDDLRDCVDYRTLHEIVLKRANAIIYKLLEKLAYQIGLDALRLRHVLSVTIKIRKPYKLVGCESVGISITLHQKEVRHEQR